MEIPNINVPNFQEKVLEHIKKLVESIESTIEQKKNILEKYVRIVAGQTQTSPTKYYMTDEGRRIVRLMYYFRDYYRNRTDI